MHCKAWNYLFLRANGEFNCYCGPGEDYVIYKDSLVSHAPVNITDNVINGAYVAIRQKLKDKRVAFPDTCPNCSFFSEHAFGGTIYTNHIEVFQIEPSFVCSMNCSICIPKQVRKKFPRPHILPLQYYIDVMDNLVQHNISISFIEFCGKGEPLINKSVADMVRIAKERFCAKTSITTNGNIQWHDDIVHCGVDRVYFSIDGASPDSYRKYRNGDWQLAINNMRRASIKAGRDQKIIWKYILFSHNDTNEELFEARRIAKDAGVELKFVFTNAPNPSRRFHSLKDMECFWQSPKDYATFEIHPPFSDKTLKQLRRFDNKGIYIFGAGAIGVEIKRFLQKKNIFIAGWIDSARHKHNTALDGLKIHSPDNLDHLDISAIIIGSKSHVPGIRNRIKKLSVPIFEIDS